MKEKKLLWSLVMVISLLLCGGGTGYAAVSGPCSNCHTMHNSQGGDWATVQPTWAATGGPRGALVCNSCLGCHTTDTTDPLDIYGYPFVKSSSASAFTDDSCLAGGFFAHDDNDGDDNEGYGHSLGSQAVPPGYNSGDSGPQGDWYKGISNVLGLGCAGSRGCHGKHDVDDEMSAIKGGHHAPAADVYRILYVNKLGVKGVGADDYEEALIYNVNTTTDGSSIHAHNVYSADAVAEETISELCANCHGDFHGDDDTSVGGSGISPFIRHPSDVVLPDDWYLGTAANVALNYDDRDRKYNPLGFPAALETEDPKATCLSCHRAHGTANMDLLRFPYADQLAGQGTADQVKYGCLGCHDKQR